MKKYLIKYSLEFLVIVMGISVSFYLEEIRVANELKTLSADLKQNLLDILMKKNISFSYFND